MAADGGVKKDFFISYTGADQAWAEWVAWVLKAAGYTVELQAWDFHVSDNFAARMHKALEGSQATIAVLSEAYFASKFCEDEWTAAYAKSKQPGGYRLIPVRISGIVPPGLLAPIVFIDLFNTEETTAENRLLAAVEMASETPSVKPGFPGGTAAPAAPAPPKPPFPGALPRVWNLVHRNPNFTGRAAQLEALRAHLIGGGTAAVTQAASISGLGGIGKSQLAIEYAYRYRADYDLAWWLRAEEEGSLAADYAALAGALDLPEKDAREQAVVLAAVRAWLEAHRRWLLIFDNAEAPGPLKDLLPRGETGHVLITSRNPTFGSFAKVLPLELWPRVESIAFLEQRTGAVGRDADALAEALGDLPLALEQAAAYCQATGERVAGYTHMLTQGHGAELFAEPRDAERTVAAVWQPSFARVEQESPAGAALLKLISFFAPDAIPLELISGGAKHLPEPLAAAVASPVRLNQAVGALLRYSLIRREGAMLSVHRLVQAVTRQRLDATEHNAWAGAAVTLLNAALPDFPFGVYDPRVDAAYNRLRTHALVAAEHAHLAEVMLMSAGRLFNDMGSYSLMRADFPGTKVPLQRARAIGERILGPDDPKLASTLVNIGLVHRAEERFDDAKTMLKRSLAMDRKTFGLTHTNVARDVSILGLVHCDEGNIRKAESAIRFSLAVNEKVLGSDHPYVAMQLENLSGILCKQGKLDGGREYIVRALKINGKRFGPHHPSVARCLTNYSYVLLAEGSKVKAIEAIQRALAIFEECFGPDHPHTKIARANLAAASKP